MTFAPIFQVRDAATSAPVYDFTATKQAVNQIRAANPKIAACFDALTKALGG